jgi:hypothetical protein
MYFYFIGHNNVQIESGIGIYWSHGSGSVSQNYGSADPNPKEIRYLRIHNTATYHTFYIRLRPVITQEFQLATRMKRTEQKSIMICSARFECQVNSISVIISCARHRNHTC